MVVEAQGDESKLDFLPTPLNWVVLKMLIKWFGLTRNHFDKKPVFTNNRPTFDVDFLENMFNPRNQRKINSKIKVLGVKRGLKIAGPNIFSRRFLDDLKWKGQAVIYIISGFNPIALKLGRLPM